MVSAYTMTANESGPTLMIRRNGAKVESNRAEYTVPPKGQYTLELTGFAEPFEMPRAEQFGGGVQQMTRLEYTILSEKGKGKKFTQMVSFTIGSKSKMGQIISAARGKPIGAGESVDLLDIIGLKFTATVTHDKTKDGVVKVDADGKPLYASVVIDTIEPLSADGEAKESSDDGWE